MARSAISVTTAVKNSQAVQTETVRAGGLTGTDGLYIPASAVPDHAVALYIRETANGATGTAWIKAGDTGEGPNVGQGDLAITVGGSAALIVGPLERARFAQNDGTIEVDVGGVTGIFAVVDLG